RSNHAMAYDAARRVTILCGGWNGLQPNGTTFGDTWEWNGTAWTLREVSGPSPRRGHAMAYDAARGVTVLFGGETGNNSIRNGETWEWSGVAWSERAFIGTPPRSYHAMAYDSARARTVMFGGGGSSGPLGDTLEWNGQSWTLVDTLGPAARS